ncbi:MAG TPA: ABC transporter substrate-binding protein [Dermatophilaceae bacterium]|nr:ABC transporter substrate-binding protein [Dermatophilaceae bacterium]
MRRTPTRLAVAVAAAVAAVSTLAGCGSNDASASGGSNAADVVRLGYFPNVTHATAIVGDKEGLFVKHLGKTKLEIKTFNDGTEAMEALRSGAIDATYVGPGPSVNTYLNSNGEALRVVAGAASGGAALVVDPAITSPAQLKGKKIATPGLGNTQDIALRYWLGTQKLSSDLQGGGDVNIAPQKNAQILDAFAQKLIAGAWVPEPYATRLVKAGGKVLVDERDLWPNQQFAVTVLSVRTDFLRDHSDSVKALLAGDLDAAEFIGSSPSKAQKDVGDVITAVSGKPLAADVISASWKSLTFTVDPIASSILTGAQHAYAVRVLKTEPKLDKLVDLTLLNQLLKERGKKAVTS